MWFRYIFKVLENFVMFFFCENFATNRSAYTLTKVRQRVNYSSKLILKFYNKYTKLNFSSNKMVHNPNLKY